MSNQHFVTKTAGPADPEHRRMAVFGSLYRTMYLVVKENCRR